MATRERDHWRYIGGASEEQLLGKETLPEEMLRDTLRNLRSRGYAPLPVAVGDLVIFLGTTTSRCQTRRHARVTRSSCMLWTGPTQVMSGAITTGYSTQAASHSPRSELGLGIPKRVLEPIQCMERHLGTRQCEAMAGRW